MILMLASPLTLVTISPLLTLAATAGSLLILTCGAPLAALTTVLLAVEVIEHALDVERLAAPSVSALRVALAVVARHATTAAWKGYVLSHELVKHG